MLNPTQDMSKRQGLLPDKLYEAVVVENNDHLHHKDKKMLGRIQVRVAIMFDGIVDKDLPWAIPRLPHADGASNISGSFYVPKIGTKVFVKFQDGDAGFPVWEGYHVDDVTQMEESKHHYPNRKVIRFQNKAMLLLDTEDNILYLRNPGNVKIYIDGNVEVEVTGNVSELIHGNVTRTIKGNLSESVAGTTHRYSTGQHTLESAGTLALEGSMIHENSGMSPGKPADFVPSEWEAIPGSAKGNNNRPKT